MAMITFDQQWKRIQAWDFESGCAVAEGFGLLIEHHPSLQPEAQALLKLARSAVELDAYATPVPGNGRSSILAELIEKIFVMRLDVGCEYLRDLGRKLMAFPEFSAATQVLFSLNQAWVMLKNNPVSERAARV